MKEIKHKGYTLLVDMSRRYSNDRQAIQLIDAADGFPYCTATVNLHDVEISDNEVIIKNWSENEGILETLQSNGIIGEVKRRIQSGFVYADVADLL